MMIHYTSDQLHSSLLLVLWTASQAYHAIYLLNLVYEVYYHTS